MLWELAQQAAKNATSRIEWKGPPRVYLNTIALGTSDLVLGLGTPDRGCSLRWMGFKGSYSLRFISCLLLVFAVVIVKGIWISHVIWIRVGMTSDRVTRNCGSHKTGLLLIALLVGSHLKLDFSPHWL